MKNQNLKSMLEKFNNSVKQVENKELIIISKKQAIQITAGDCNVCHCYGGYKCNYKIEID